MKNMAFVIMLFILSMAVSGCAVPGKKENKNIDNRMSELTKKKQEDMKQEAPVQDHEGEYIGSERMELQQDKDLPNVFHKKITMAEGPLKLPRIANKISETTGVPIELSSRLKYIKEKKRGQDVDEEEKRMFTHQIQKETEMKLNFEGKLKDLLNNVANYYGASWEWRGRKVYMFRLKTKTYNLITTPGQVQVQNVISNESETSGGGSSSSSQGERNVQGFQKAHHKYQFNIWDKTVNNIKSMLSESGKVVANQSSGTVSVTDTPESHKEIKEYLDQINNKLSRQVALSVKIFSFKSEQAQDYGFSAQTIFKDMNDEIGATLKTANPLSLGDATGMLSATILEQKEGDDNYASNLHQWSGSEAVIKALDKHGNVSLVTSGSGIVMNNQPFPIQNVNRIGYLQSSGMSQGEAATTQELESGTLTTGFSMSATPHILKNNKVVLQYNITLSKLIDMKVIEAGGSKIQTPETTSRNFMQQVQMKMGETLFLAGYQRQSSKNDDSVNAGGLLGFQKKGNKNKRLVLISIKVAEVSR